MKLNLIVENKELVIPDFDLFLDENNSKALIFLLKNIKEEEEEILLKIIKENSFNNKVYLFKINKNITIKNKHILIDFYNEYNIIKNKNKKIIDTNEYKL